MSLGYAATAPTSFPNCNSITNGIIMRIHRLLRQLSFLVAALTLVPSVSFGQLGGIRWRNNLDAAKIEAAQSNRLVLLHFWSPSCGPCRRLEQNVFPLPQVGPAIEQNYVPVKMNADVSQAFAYAFHIDRVPTDIVLTSQGRVVTKLSCPSTPDAYIGQLSNVASHYRQQVSRPAVAAPQVQVNTAYTGLQAQQPVPQVNTPVPSIATAQIPASNVYAAGNVYNQPAVQVSQPTQAYSTPAVPAGAMPSSYRSPSATPKLQSVTLAGASPAKPQATAPSQPAVNPVVRNSATPTQSAPPALAAATVAQTATRPAVPSSIQLPAGSPPLGFDGYCPISLKFAKKWVRGDVRFGAIHRGRTYLFVNDQKRQQFLADPDAYSPVFSGIDPVMFLDDQQSLEGSRRFGYEYRGAFYLFSSAESMQKFASQPDQYSGKVRQAMNQIDTGAGTIRK